MPTATQPSTTPTRRATLAMSVAAFAAGLAAPALASTCTVDAELIRLCDRVVAIQKAIDALCAVRHTIEDEERTQPAMNALFDDLHTVEGRIYSVGDPETWAGARAMARAAVADAEKDFNGSMLIRNLDDWLAMSICKFLLGDAAA